MKRLALALFLLAALMPGQAPAQTARTPPVQTARTPPVQAAQMSLSDYRELVRACRRAAEGTPSPGTTETLSRRLRAVRRVLYADGQRVAVNNDELARLLGDAARSKKAKGAAAARLRTLDALLTPPGTNSALAPDPRGQAADILAGAEFRRAAALEAENKPKDKSWWERWMDRFWESVRRFFEKLFPKGALPGADTAGLGSTFLFVFYFLGGVIVLVLLYLLTRVLRERRSGRRRSGRAGGVFSGEAGDEDLPDPLAAARDRAGAGDYRAALRLTYLACLRRLHGAGLLVLDGDKTNWEYQRTLRARSSGAHEILLPVTRDFDRVWYGQIPATPEEYERALRAHDALPEAAAPDHPPVGSAK